MFDPDQIDHAADAGDEGIEAAEGLVYGLGELAARLPAFSGRSQQAPEQRVVVMAAAVVAHRHGLLAYLAHQLLKGHVGLGLAFEGLVQVVYVGFVVLAMVEAQRLGGNRRFAAQIGANLPD